MIYDDVHEGVFLSRPNRFIAHVEIDGRSVKCHVKNTGRCKELLIPGAKVYLQKSGNLKRSTAYDLIAVYKGDRLINMDSQAPNAVIREYLESGRFIEGITLLKPEARYGDSRFDFYVEAGPRRIFIEVKGVTLEREDVALFPDAPTERGVKHLNELAACLSEGYEAQVIFAIQMKSIRSFSPNETTHPAFSAALSAAASAGVKVIALDCAVEKDRLTISDPVPVILREALL